MTVQQHPAGQRPPPPADWYARSPQDVASAFGVDPAVGLSAARVAELLAASEHGRATSAPRGSQPPLFSVTVGAGSSPVQVARP
jgi:hypothetical protein